MRKLVVTTPVIRDLAWRYIAGENLDAGLAAVRTLNSRGIKATLNNVGTHVRDPQEAVAAADAAIAALVRIQQECVDANLSIKLTQIGLDVSEVFCREQLRRVLDCAARLGNFVRIDMEETPYVDATLRLFDEMRRDYGTDTVGIVIQSYLRDRGGDFEQLLADRARVRLVKGGYWESAAVAYQKKADIDAAFRRDIDFLLTRGYQPALATHDARMVDEAIEIAAARGLDKRDFEFQMLYGVRPDLQESLVRDGYTVRCYIPYGGQWYAYFIGCIRQSLGAWLGRFTGRRPAHRRTHRADQREQAVAHNVRA